MKASRWLLVALCFSPSIEQTPAWSYDVEVHAVITARAVEQASRVGDTLLNLGFSAGIQTLFSDSGMTRRADQWLQEGARLEDVPDFRVRHHFHNPLAPTWSEAGLHVFGGQVGDSSVLWQQNVQQQDSPLGGEGSWSWPNARQFYFDALTHGAEEERSRNFAGLFRSLGQVMHLVQDASVPAHSRDDPHLYKSPGGHDLPNPDGYERWVDKAPPATLNSLLARDPIRPSDRVFVPVAVAPRIERSGAPAPVSGLIDIGLYLGGNPEVTATPPDNRPVIGMAEFSNANFFSDDTLFADTAARLDPIPFPSRTSVEWRLFTPPAGQGPRRPYLVKVRHGETTLMRETGPDNYRLAVPTALHPVLPDFLRYRRASLDPGVYADYAALLLPRAVGYSAALLDYFFRGRLSAEAEPDGVRVVNRTPNEAMSGFFWLYAEADDGSRSLLGGGWPLSLAPDEASGLQEVRPVPADSPIMRCILVFRGRLGQEADAVAVTLLPCPRELEAPPPPAPPPPPEPCNHWQYAVVDASRYPATLTLMFDLILPLRQDPAAYYYPLGGDLRWTSWFYGDVNCDGTPLPPSNPNDG